MRTSGKPRHLRKLCGAGLPFALFLLFTPPVYADAIVPTLIIVWPLAWLLLPLVILLEAAVSLFTLGTGYRRGLGVAGAANLASTALGVPLAWIVLFALELVVSLFPGADPGSRHDTLWAKLVAVAGNALVLGPSDIRAPQPAWMDTAGLAFLCVPFFFVSVWCEYRVARRYFEKEQWRQVRRWAWLGNALSYGLILVVLAVLLLRELHHQG